MSTSSVTRLEPIVGCWEQMSATQCCLRNLPEDILLEVASYLLVTDILSLKQTCRTLHAFGSTDYVWHRLAQSFELPFSLPYGTEIADLSQSELQPMIMKALRLEDNWRKSTPSPKRIRAVIRDTSEPYVEAMDLLLDGSWLLTIQRHRLSDGCHLSFRVSLWALDAIGLDGAECTTTFTVDGDYRAIAVDICDGGQSAILAIGVRNVTEYIEVHSVSLCREPAFTYSEPVPARRIPLRHHPQFPSSSILVFKLAIYDGIIAALIMIPGAHIALQLLLIDLDSGSTSWVNPRDLQPLSILYVGLQKGQLLFSGASHSTNKLVLRIYPTAGISSAIRASSVLDLGPKLTEYEDSTAPPPLMYDLHRASRLSPHCLSIVTFISASDLESGTGQVTRFPIPCPSAPATSRPRVVDTKSFAMASYATAQLAEIGPTGRAVWVEHNWEAHTKRFMRYQPREGERVGLLLPPHPALPFTPSECHSFAFDEVIGRLCVGLFNGDIYVLDFV